MDHPGCWLPSGLHGDPAGAGAHGGMEMDGKTFGNIEEYYGENAERRYSVEADYGFHWRLDGEPERWRVSYVRNTGEVYAVRLAERAPGRDVVEVLGTFPGRPGAGCTDIYYRGLDAPTWTAGGCAAGCPGACRGCGNGWRWL